MLIAVVTHITARVNLLRFKYSLHADKARQDATAMEKSKMERLGLLTVGGDVQEGP